MIYVYFYDTWVFKYEYTNDNSEFSEAADDYTCNSCLMFTIIYHIGYSLLRSFTLRFTTAGQGPQALMRDEKLRDPLKSEVDRKAVANCHRLALHFDRIDRSSSSPESGP